MAIVVKRTRNECGCLAQVLYVGELNNKKNTVPEAPGTLLHKGKVMDKKKTPNNIFSSIMEISVSCVFYFTYLTRNCKSQSQQKEKHNGHHSLPPPHYQIFTLMSVKYKKSLQKQKAQTPNFLYQWITLQSHVPVNIHYNKFPDFSPHFCSEVCVCVLFFFPDIPTTSPVSPTSSSTQLVPLPWHSSPHGQVEEMFHLPRRLGN